MLTAAEQCVTCGSESGTPFCGQCGERRASDRSHTLRALWDEILDAFSPADGRVARTLWSLVRRPGELTVEYLRGVRQPYVPPLRLFLIVNVLFFLHASLVGNHTFDTPLNVHLSQTEHATIAKRLVRARLTREVGAYQRALGRTATTMERDSIVASYAKRFDASSTTQAKSLVIVIVPFYALLLAVADWRRRRPLLHDVVFATHAIALLLLLMIGARYLIGLPIGLALHAMRTAASDHQQDMLFSSGLALAFAVWLRAGLRRAYGDGPIVASVKAVALAGGLAIALFAYRALLFFSVFYTT